MRPSPLVVGYAALSAVAAIALVVGLITGDYRAIERSDYMMYHTAARIVVQGNGDCLYVEACQAAAQEELIGEEPSFTGGALPFNSPPLLAAVFAPLGWLSLPAGFAIFVIISLIVLAAATWRLAWGGAATRALAVIIVLSSWPTAMAVVRGQASLLVIGGIGLSVASMNARGGLALGLAALKPTLVPVWAVWLAYNGKWRTIGAALLVLVALTVLTLIVVSPQAIADYPNYVLGVAAPDATGVHVEQMVNWRGAGYRLGLGSWFVVGGAMLTLLVVAVAWWRTRTVRLTAALALIATPLVIPHANQHEAILAILGVVFALAVAKDERPWLVAAALGLNAILWLGPVLDGSTSGALLFAAELAALAVVAAVAMRPRPTP
jgi:hypothetical protein